MESLRGFFLATAVAMAVAGGGSLTLTSPGFAAGGTIPRLFTCEGQDVSPPLRWQGVPPSAESLALIVDDPDAPKGTWVHWVVYNLPPTLGELAQGVTVSEMPPGTGQGLNDWGRTGYGGPCPPSGRHRYVFALYALDTRLEGLDRPTKGDLLQAMRGHVVAKARLTGTYRKGATE